MKYKDWLKTWLELYVKPAVKGQTYQKYEYTVRCHIAPELGKYYLKQLNEELLQNFVAKLVKRFAPSTINGIIAIIKKSLNDAAMIGIFDRDKNIKVHRPKMREKRVECFTLAEQRKLEEAIIEKEDYSMYGVIICLYTGLRIGELLSLKWSDIDFHAGTLSVTKSTYYAKGDDGFYQQMITTPKTDSSVRTIPLPKQLVPYIKKLKRHSKGEFVIGYLGHQMTTRTYQYWFSRLLQRLGIPHRGFHSLRHTFATRALECGMEIKTLSEILGHKNATLTMNRYAHSMIEYKKDMMDKLGKLLD